MPYGAMPYVGGVEPGGAEPLPTGQDDWLMGVLKAQKILELLNKGLGEDQGAPSPVTFPRAEMPEIPGMTPYEELPRWQRGVEKGADVAMLLAGALANRKARKTGAPVIGAQNLPLLSRSRQQEEMARAAMQAQIGEQNRGIAEKEIRYNDERMQDYTGRRASRLNAMLPSILSNVLRESKGPSANEADIETKMRLLKSSEAYRNASPAQKAEMEVNMLGAYTRAGARPRQTPEEAYKLAYERIRGGIDARKAGGVLGGGAGGTDLAEKDVQDAARLMVKYIYEDGYDEDEAYRMTMEYVRTKHKLRRNIGEEEPETAPKKYRFRADRQGVTDPAVQRKIEIYAAQISKFPSRREMLRKAILREHNIDPDALIEEDR